MHYHSSSSSYYYYYYYYYYAAPSRTRLSWGTVARGARQDQGDKQ